MDALAKEYLVSFYSNNLTLHGDRPEAVRWTPEGQRIRYRVILSVVPNLDGKRILDYGCGKGDLYGFLKETGIKSKYTGIDINPNLIRFAQMKHPEANFMVSDVEDCPLEEDFDIVFLCGVFNNRVQGVDECMKNVITQLFEHTREALALNALSSHSRQKDMELNYTSPEELSFFVQEHLTPHLETIHGYLPGDFTMFLYKK